MEWRDLVQQNGVRFRYMEWALAKEDEERWQRLNIVEGILEVLVVVLILLGGAYAVGGC